jgi:hypothetical protein
MNGLTLGRGDCSVLAQDIARAKSTLLALRVKIDTRGHSKVYGYGQALQHVANLIATDCGISATDALSARGVTVEEMDRVYQDLFSSARRCRSFHREGTPAYEMADNLATACSVLKNLYRMRFHCEKASGSQKVDAEDLAERFVTLTRALSQLGMEAKTPRHEPSIQMAA